MKTKAKPDWSKPIDVYAFFDNALRPCGCADEAAMLTKVRDVMADLALSGSDAQVPWDRLVAKHFHEDEALAYLVMGHLDHAGLIEHGVAIRCSWLTEDGAAGLAALQAHDIEALCSQPDEAAYDGVMHGSG
jgi:hypothetical protein